MFRTRPAIGTSHDSANKNLVHCAAHHGSRLTRDPIGKTSRRIKLDSSPSITSGFTPWIGAGRDALLLLHGIGDTPHSYDDFAPKFTNQFRVLGLTRRGHRESKIPTGGYDTATRLEEIRQFLNALNIRRATLVGHSAAGNEVSLFATTHPERATKRVYLDAAL
jgi:non-heme chloroperoxidase